MTQIQNVRASVPPVSSSPPEDATQITINPESPETAFFGKDGLTFGDLVDAINPLNHIPVISDLVNDGSESKPSVASQLIGGALLGGPIGFVASLANCIFEQATGHGVAGAMVAALSGEQTGADATQYAANETAADGAEEQEVAMNDAVPFEAEGNIQPTNVVDQTSTRPLDVSKTKDAMQVASVDRYTDIAQRAKAGMMPDTSGTSDDDERNKAILGLFGASAPSASRAYNNAQMMPYLKQANSQVL